MARPMILVYNLSGERLSKLRFACMKTGLLLKTAQEEDFPRPIGAVCGIVDQEADDAPFAPFTDEMLVFAHMDHMSVNRFLQTVKQLRAPQIALKAILTPTNARWHASQLHDELMAERAAIQGGQSPQHE